MVAVVLNHALPTYIRMYRHRLSAIYLVYKACLIPSLSGVSVITLLSWPCIFAPPALLHLPRLPIAWARLLATWPSNRPMPVVHDPRPPQEPALGLFRKQVPEACTPHPKDTLEILWATYRPGNKRREHARSGCQLTPPHTHTPKVHHHHHHHHGHHPLRWPHSPITCSRYARLILPRLVSAACISKSSDSYILHFIWNDTFRPSKPSWDGRPMPPVVALLSAIPG
ncbi:hypothetical protein B0T13DRAFT_216034 [Neurospora crassa]|nr:hypothetical protein B0T13DRAFT_216034 [Neurospora crassa]